MRKYVHTGYGAVRDNVRLVETEEPQPGLGEILIDVQAASLNPIDFKMIEGALKAVQKLHFPSPLGFDGSGIVRSIGPGTTYFKPGDSVYFRAPREQLGSFAERCVISQSHAALKPERLTHAEAASMPLVGLTTVQGVLRRAKPKPGRSILIHAGSGGVGSFAVQYATALGLSVTTTCSARNYDLVKSLGPLHVIAYDQEDYRERPDRYDIVFDTVGGDITLDSFKVAKPGGVVVSIAGPPTVEMADQLDAGFVVRTAMWWMSRKVRAASKKYGVAYHGFFTESNGMQLSDIASMASRREVRPVIDRSFAFEQLVDGLEYLKTGHACGKVILEIGRANEK